MQTSAHRSPETPGFKGIERSRPAQKTGAASGAEKRRTAKLAQELPRGIKIGARHDGRPKPFFVRWGHPRKTESFESEQDRNDRADDLAGIKKEHGDSSMRFDPQEWAEFKEWKKKRDAVDRAVKIKEGAQRWLDVRASHPQSEDARSHEITYMRRLVEWLGNTPLSEIKEANMVEVLERLKKDMGVGPASIRHHRKTYVQFFKWCAKQKPPMILENPLADVPPPKVEKNEDVSVFQLKEAFEFFKVNRNERAIGKLALETFGGVRHEHAGAVGLADVLFEESALVLPGAGRKIKRRHVIDGWPKNLFKWLKHTSPDCWTLTPRSYTNHKTLAFARARVTNPGNVMRHTFATAHLSAFKNRDATKELMTHQEDSDVFEAHYRGRGYTQATARAFFMITPKTVLLSFERFCRMVGVTNKPT